MLFTNIKKSAIVPRNKFLEFAFSSKFLEETEFLKNLLIMWIINLLHQVVSLIYYSKYFVRDVFYCINLSSKFINLSILYSICFYYFYIDFNLCEGLLKSYFRISLKMDLKFNRKWTIMNFHSKDSIILIKMLKIF